MSSYLISFFLNMFYFFELFKKFDYLVLLNDFIKDNHTIYIPSDTSLNVISWNNKLFKKWYSVIIN